MGEILIPIDNPTAELVVTTTLEQQGFRHLGHLAGSQFSHAGVQRHIALTAGLNFSGGETEVLVDNGQWHIVDVVLGPIALTPSKAVHADGGILNIRLVLISNHSLAKTFWDAVGKAPRLQVSNTHQPLLRSFQHRSVNVLPLVIEQSVIGAERIHLEAVGQQFGSNNPRCFSIVNEIHICLPPFRRVYIASTLMRVATRVVVAAKSKASRAWNSGPV